MPPLPDHRSVSACHLIVWHYRVAPDAAAEFERAYGPDGAWARLFARHAGYRGTELVRGEEAGTYLTIDRWDSEAAFEAFMRGSRDEYEGLDARLASLTESEVLVLRGAVQPAARGNSPGPGGTDDPAPMPADSVASGPRPRVEEDPS